MELKVVAQFLLKAFLRDSTLPRTETVYHYMIHFISPARKLGADFAPVFKRFAASVLKDVPIFDGQFFKRCSCLLIDRRPSLLLSLNDSFLPVVGALIESLNLHSIRFLCLATHSTQSVNQALKALLNSIPRALPALLRANPPQNEVFEQDEELGEALTVQPLQCEFANSSKMVFVESDLVPDRLIPIKSANLVHVIPGSLFVNHFESFAELLVNGRRLWAKRCTFSSSHVFDRPGAVGGH
jgi:hypothetical protein